MRFRLASLLAAVVVVAPVSAAAADVVALVAPASRGVPSDELAAAQLSLTAALERGGHHRVVTVAAPAGAGGDVTVGEAAAIAHATGASATVVVSVVRVDSGSALRLAVYRSNGTVAMDDRAELGPNEPPEAAVPALAAAVAQALSEPPPSPALERSGPPDPGRGWDAADAGPAAPGHLRLKGTSIRLSTMFAQNRASRDPHSSVLGGASVVWWAEAGRIQVEIFADVYVSDAGLDLLLDRTDPAPRKWHPDHFVGAGPGLIVPLTLARTGPYVGLEGGIARYVFGGGGAGGFFYRMPAGVLFQRWGEYSFRVEAAVFSTTARELDRDTGERRTPWGWTVSVLFTPDRE